MEKHILPDREYTEHGPLQPFSNATTKNMHLEICRVCLANSGLMVNIFGSTSELGIPIAEMISLVTGHYVFKDEFFSEIICQPCLEDATKAFTIKQTYEMSYQLLCQVKEDFQEVEDLGVQVKTEPLDGWTVDSMEHEKLNQCPVKNEPIGEEFEEGPYQIYDGGIQPENKRIKGRGKRYESKQLQKCTYCPKTFPKGSKLEEHIRCHTRERPFKCPQCPCVFTTKRSVTRHLESHVVDKPFKCSHCSCSYKNKSSLKRHLTKHKNITLLKCDLCQRSYTYKRTFDSHRVNCVIMTKLISSGAMIVPTP